MAESDDVAWARSRFPGLHAVSPPQAALLSVALAARLSGDFSRAAEQYLLAAKEAAHVSDRLHHQLRAANAMIVGGTIDPADDLVGQIIAVARSTSDTQSLADALTASAIVAMHADRPSEGFAALAEAVHLADQLDDSPSSAAILDNAGLALTHYGLVEESQGFHQRAADAATAPDLRCRSLAQLTTCRTVMAADAADETTRAGHVALGVEIASEVIDLDGGGDSHAVALARANRSVLSALGGRHRDAGRDAAAVLASATPLTPSIEAIALTGSAMARWAADGDVSVVDDCQRVVDIAPHRQVDHCIDLAVHVHLDALRVAGRPDELRDIFDQHLARFRRLRDRHHDLERAHIRLGVAHHRAEALSEIDPLTGLHNRRYLDRFISDLVAEAQRGAESGCVAVIDLDGFKAVNDDHGYAAGDGLLRELAAELQRQCRRADGVARLGGDEFVVVLRGTAIDNARRVLERIRAAVAERRWPALPSTVRVTTSIGFAMAAPDGDAGSLIDEASQAMQFAKRAGRDRVVAWDDVQHRAPDRRTP